MRINLIGTGAMASLFGARLASIADVTLLGTWAEGLAAIQERGIVVEGPLGAATFQVQAARLGTLAKPAELILVFVKAWQTASVVPYLPALLAPGGVIVTLQNGIGNLEQLGPRAYLGMTTNGSTLVGPGRVRPGGTGPTHLAGPEWVVEVFRRAGFETHPVEASNMKGLLWGKLTVNCGINALTAILRVSNGELLKRDDAALLMDRAAVECAMVAWSQGIVLPFAEPMSEVRKVAERTAANQSSMLQDVLRGAPTEVDYINGAVVKEGHRLGIHTAVNEVLWRLVRALTPHPREPWRVRVTTAELRPLQQGKT
jgi:2-dehydropantoate 2-reductase